MEIPEKLLTDENAKTPKGEKYGYKTYIMYLNPWKENLKGVNLCPMATKDCISSCISNTGRMNFAAKARAKRTEFYIDKRPQFMQQLFHEIGIAKLRSEVYEQNLVIRLNGTSDIQWENAAGCKVFGKTLFEHYPDVQFMDYTKISKRLGNTPANYHLTYSWNGTNREELRDVLSRGFNVAVVFRKRPEFFMGYEVVDGDRHDLRFLDQGETGKVIGLKYKSVTKKGYDNYARKPFIIEPDDPECVFAEKKVIV